MPIDGIESPKGAILAGFGKTVPKGEKLVLDTGVFFCSKCMLVAAELRNMAKHSDLSRGVFHH